MGILQQYFDGQTRTKAFGMVGETVGVDMDPVGVVVFGLGIVALPFPFRGHEPMVDLSLFRIASFSFGSALITVYFLGMTSV